MDRASLIAAMQVTAAAVKPRAVSIKGWGELFVRPLTVAEVDEAQEFDGKATDKRTLARGAARLICDADGNRIFDATNSEDVELLARQPWSRLQKVLEMTTEEKDEAEGN